MFIPTSIVVVLIIATADFNDSDSDCSIEVMDDWQESFAEVMVVEKEYNSDSDDSSECDDDDDVLELLTRIVDLAKKQQRETSELERTILNQTKRLVSSINASKTATGECRSVRQENSDFYVCLT